MNVGLALLEEQWAAVMDEILSSCGQQATDESKGDKQMIEIKEGKRMKWREAVLEDAKKCVCGQREQDYGSPEDNFSRIAYLWSCYLGVDVSALDVAMCMALLKIARIKTGGGTGDSFVDLAGYAACGGEIYAKNREKIERRIQEIKADDSRD